MRTKLRTVSVMLGLLVMLMPQAASAALTVESEDVLQYLQADMGPDSYADRCPTGMADQRMFQRFTLVIQDANQRIIYQESTYLRLPAGHVGRAVIVEIDGNGTLEI